MPCEVREQETDGTSPTPHQPEGSPLCSSRASPLPWACYLHLQFFSECMCLISVRPRKTVRGKQGVIPPTARPGRRPGKKPHPTRRARPKAPPADDTEVDELVRIILPPRSSISGSYPLLQHQEFTRQQVEPPLCSLPHPPLWRLRRQMDGLVGRRGSRPPGAAMPGIPLLRPANISSS